MALRQFHPRVPVLAWIALPATLAGAEAFPPGPPFSLAAAGLRQASAAIPAQPDQPVMTLLYSVDVHLDADGRSRTRTHYIYRVDQESALPYVGNVGGAWTAWYEDRPVVRARVVNPDGQEHALDPATLGEFRPQQKDPEVYTDRKELRAPLPKLTLGSIVEVEVLEAEARPFCRSGSRGGFAFAAGAPVACARFHLEAPRGVNVRIKCENFPDRLVRRETRGDQVHYDLALGPHAAQKQREPMQDPREEEGPVLMYTTVPSWRSVAREYGALVRQQVGAEDLADLARTAAGDAQGRDQIIERVLAYVQKNVRYTGLEFGEASIVPQPPREVLRRGYGDCKDKATLLAALLEAKGVPARVALLRATAEAVLDPDLPCMNRFDHAIVHLPGDRPMWIDPAVRMARAGQLPPQDQGRRALIIDDATQELVEIPVDPAERNLVTQTIEVFMAEDGLGRVVETTEAGGATGIAWREGYSRVDPQKLEAFLKQRSAGRYMAEALGKVDLRDPADLGRPFQLRCEALKTGCAATGSREAVAQLFPWALVDAFSDLMNATNVSEASAGSGNKEDRAPEPRRTTLVLPNPFAEEARWILHPPSGYALPTLPEDRTWTFGPARLTCAFARGEGKAVIARLRFECAQLRWTPAQVAEARAALKAFGAASRPEIRFQNTGEAHLAAGRIKEALAEFQASRAAAPGAAAPLMRLARAQVAGGLGVSARASAQAALALEPGSAQAQVTLGWVLQHDLAGRRHKEGWDPAGALAAYRRAVQLDPKARPTRYALAQLLEVDARGERFGADPAAVDEAIRIYEGLEAEERNETVQGALVRALAQRGRYAEAQAICKPRLGSDAWSDWYVAMAVCAKGLQAGLADTDQAFQALERRQQACLKAGDLLVGFRRYREAAALLDEGAPAAENQTQTRARAEALARAGASAPAWPARDPKGAALLFLLRLLDPKDAQRPLTAHLARAQRDAWNPELLLRLGRRIMNLPAFRGCTRDGVADLLPGYASLTQEGSDAQGWKVRCELPGLKLDLLVAREDGGYRIVAPFMDEASAGRQALEAVDRGDLMAAGGWLDLALEQAYAGWASDPLSPNPLHRLRTKGAAQSRADLRAAAASVLALSPSYPLAPEPLRAYLAQVQDPLKQATVRKALAHALLRAGGGREADLVTNQMLVAYPTSFTALDLRVVFLNQARRFPEALDLTRRVLALAPEDLTFLKHRYGALKHVGRDAEAAALLEAPLAKGRFGSQDYLDLVLLHLELGQVDARILEWARRATKNTEDQTSANLQVLAAVLADLGRTSEARETVLTALGLSNRTTPRPEDWYVFGRIAEQLGDFASAQACYANVVPDRAYPLADAHIFHDMAGRRAAALAARPR